MSLAAPPILAPPQRRSPAFLLAYALANAGGVIAYLPLLTLLLPIKVEAIAGPNRFGLLTATVVVGAIAASAANILFGWLSDRAVAKGGGRRSGVAWGLFALALGVMAVALAATPVALVAGVAAFQAGVNALLAPLLAIMADEIPDAQKGVAGGLLALGQPVAAAVGAQLVSGGTFLPFALVVLATTLCVAPLLLTPHRAAGDEAIAAPRQRRLDLAVAWTARLLVQVAGAVLSLFLLFYFESVAALPSPLLAGRLGHLLTLAYLLPLPVAVVAGRVSDRTGRRRPVLLAAALLAAAGLVGMGVARDWTGGAWAFGAYAVGSAVFLALHAAYAMQLLPSATHRGRDLGLINLANTLPQLAGPLLAWSLATPRDFSGLMLVLAALTGGGGVLMMAVQRRQ